MLWLRSRLEGGAAADADAGEESFKAPEGPARASSKAAFLRALASMGEGGGNGLDEEEEEAEEGPASLLLKSGCGMEKGLCMAEEGPMRGSRSMEAVAADMVVEGSDALE